MKSSTFILNSFAEKTLRFFGCGACVVVLSLPVAGVTAPAQPIGAGKPETMATAPPVLAKWNASDISKSYRAFADQQPEQPLRCTNGVTPLRSVLINPDSVGIRIGEASAPPRLLVLRDGLLPEVHYLRDGRHAVMATRNGWVMKIDLAQARLVAEVRVGMVLRGVALSASHAGWPSLLAVANAEPHTLAMLDEGLALVKLLRVADKADEKTSGVAAVRTAVTRNSFVATLTDIPELWEISYDPQADGIPQRTTLPSPTEDFFLTETGRDVLTAHADLDFSRPGASARVQVTNLDLRRKVAEWALPGWPALGGSWAWSVNGKDRLAVPNARLGLVSILDSARWTVLGHLRTDGPVRALRSTRDSPWLWLDAGVTAEDPASMLRVDKSTLEVEEGLVDASDTAPRGSFIAPSVRCPP